ncbi:MAG: hypothetical protein NT157_02275 [Candidatus Micrarchaeota archaeon]|nr:hypothetical protein [Candidatus Micrarchaeota archaeon]
MYEDEMATINSEMRYISLELMKIASKDGRSFEEVAEEFVSNVYRLETIIKSRSRGAVGVRMSKSKLGRKGKLGEL